MKPCENTLCLGIPENTDRGLVQKLINQIQHDHFSHYHVRVVELPHNPRAIYSSEVMKTFLEETRQYGSFAFLPFPDGSIHFALGEVIIDKWHHKHDSCVYEVHLDGKMIAHEPLELFDHFLTRGQTSSYVWDPTGHYMRIFH